MLQGSVPDFFATWHGKWVGRGSMDASGSQQASVLPQQAPWHPGFLPLLCLAEEAVLPMNARETLREQAPLVPVSSHHRAACGIGVLDLKIQTPFCSHIREEWHLDMEEAQVPPP